MLKAEKCLNGQEQYEPFRSRGRRFVQYDFRTEDEQLFTCIGRDLAACRAKRDKWFADREEG